MELTLFLDHQCNLRCSYCYTGEKFTRRMPAQVMNWAVDLALLRRPPHVDVAFFGGEPLIHRDLIAETIAYAEAQARSLGSSAPGLRFVLNTNATLLDADVLRLFPPSRASAFFVSLDGPREVHDRFRVNAAGEGSYDAVLAGLALLRERRLLFQLVGVVNAATARHVGETVRAALPLGAAKIALSPNLRDDWTEEDIAHLRLGLHDAADAWMAEFRAGRPYPLEPLHGKILTHLKGGIPCPARCMLGGSELAVAPSGRIYPCAQMIGEDRDEALVIGHVDTGVDAEAVRRLQDAKDRVEASCAPCAVRDRCQSHCGCRHVALTGKLGEITAVLCEVERAMIDEADRVAEELYAERCPAFLEYYYHRTWVGAAGGRLTPLRRGRSA